MRIRSGRYPPGQLLYSEVLERELGVSKTVVREDILDAVAAGDAEAAAAATLLAQSQVDVTELLAAGAVKPLRRRRDSATRLAPPAEPASRVGRVGRAR